MSIEKNWRELLKPNVVNMQAGSDPEKKSTLVVEPLERGYGITLGNSLRRVLLSSLQGSAVYGFKIDGVLHEFSSISGVREDVIDIALNIKKIIFGADFNGSKILTLEKIGPGVVTAGDISLADDIEVMNTDAEGRLVLADALTYTEEKFKPKFIVDLATLTGAIIVSLGSEYAGLFSNDDNLSKQLIEAGEKVEEKVWRMPLNKNFDKLIDSKNADMQNINYVGGAGSTTAAQFLQRFILNKNTVGSLRYCRHGIF